MVAVQLVQLIYFAPAAIFFTVLLTVLLLKPRKKRRHRRGQNPITPIQQWTAQLTAPSDTPAPKAPSNDNYVEDSQAFLATFRGADRGSGSGKRRGF
jgi:hypothetical protein